MVSLIICIVLIIVIIFLLIKIALMRKSMGEIASSLDNILDGDTNAVITVSSVDGSVRNRMTFGHRLHLYRDILSFFRRRRRAKRWKNILIS